MSEEKEKEKTYILPVTEAETRLILLALDEFTEDNPMNTNTAQHLHKKTELLNLCIQKDNELSEARVQLMEYAGCDFYDND